MGAPYLWLRGLSFESGAATSTNINRSYLTKLRDFFLLHFLMIDYDELSQRSLSGLATMRSSISATMSAVSTRDDDDCSTVLPALLCE